MPELTLFAAVYVYLGLVPLLALAVARWPRRLTYEPPPSPLDETARVRRPGALARWEARRRRRSRAGCAWADEVAVHLLASGATAYLLGAGEHELARRAVDDGALRWVERDRVVALPGHPRGPQGTEGPASGASSGALARAERQKRA